MISKLQYISQIYNGKSHADVIKEACDAGVDWVQLRMKNGTYNTYLKEAIRVQEICKKHNVTLIINDNVSIAKEINATGVHLGKSDMPPIEARAILGEKAIIGATANSLEDIISLSKQDIDYIGLGPLRYTSTKKNTSPVLGFSGYKKIIKELKINKITVPIIAIGGIELSDITPLFSLGIQGIAISGLITRSSAKKELINQILKKSSTAEVMGARQITQQNADDTD